MDFRTQAKFQSFPSHLNMQAILNVTVRSPADFI